MTDIFVASSFWDCVRLATPWAHDVVIANGIPALHLARQTDDVLSHQIEELTLTGASESPLGTGMALGAILP